MIRIFALILIPFFSMSQNFTEIVNYINGILKTHTYNVESPPSYLYHHYRQILIDKTGKLTLLDYRENRKTHVYFDKSILSYSYLKALRIGDSKDLPESEFSVFVNCESGKACVIEPETPILNASKENSINFRFDDSDARDNFKKAF